MCNTKVTYACGSPGFVLNAFQSVIVLGVDVLEPELVLGVELVTVLELELAVVLIFSPSIVAMFVEISKKRSKEAQDTSRNIQALSVR